MHRPVLHLRRSEEVALRVQIHRAGDASVIHRLTLPDHGQAVGELVPLNAGSRRQRNVHNMAGDVGVAGVSRRFAMRRSRISSRIDQRIRIVYDASFDTRSQALPGTEGDEDPYFATDTSGCIL